MTRDGVRAVALAAIMVVSMVAVGAGFAGSAVAQDAGQGDVVVLDQNGEAIDASPFGSVQAAVEGASSGQTVVVGAGTYDENVEIDVAQLTVRSADGANPTVNGVVTLTASGVTVDGLTVDGGSSGAPIDVQAGDVTVSNNTVVGGSPAGGISTWGGPGPVTGDVSIRDNTVESGPIGLVVDSQSTDIEIRNNTVSDTTSEGVWLSDYTSDADISGAEITVADNEFENVSLADLKVEQSAPSSLNGDGDLESPGTAAQSFLADSNAETVTLWDGGTYDADGNVVVLDGESIQDAVNAAETGDTIVVESGTYDEQVTVDTDDLSIVAAGSDSPTITSDSGPVVTVKGADLTLSGVDIDGNETFDNGNLGVSVRNGASVSLSDIDFEGLYGAVQTLSGDANSFTATDVTVSNAVFAFGHQSEAGIAVVRDSNISVNTQGIGIYKANNALVENNTITVESDAIDGAEPVFSKERGIDFSGSNVTIVDNEITSTNVGILSESHGIPVEDVTVTDNTIDADVVAVDDAPDNLDLNTVLANNDFERAAFVSDTDGIQSNAVFGSIDAAVDAATDGDSIVVESGTYDETVTADTANVSIVGQGEDTVINGLVYLRAEDVLFANLAVEPDEFVRPDDGRISPDERQAILVTAPNVTVVDTSVNVSLDANGSFEEVNGIQVFRANGPLTGVTVVDNEVTGTAENATAAGVVGVSDQGETEGTLIQNNTIDVHGGYSFGVVTRASDGDNVDGTPESVVVENTIEATADVPIAGIGYGIESTDDTKVDASVQLVKRNNFEAGSIQHKADSGTLDVTGNYWTDLSDVEFVTDGSDYSYQNGGKITYDPFLTVEPSELNASSVDETTEFGHDLVIPADGDTHSVAFPAATEGTVSDVFGENFNGSVYAYNGSAWVGNSEIADQRISALDAFAVTIDEDESDQRITFEYADADSEIPEMTSTELEAGWNFVGAPSNGTVSNAFGVSTTEVASVVNVVGGPADKSTPYRLAGSDEINPTTVGPFQGYWVFATDDGELGAAVPVGPTQSDEETTLKGS